uniref:CCHC-type domain-containing protein n=1 Tax=Heliothis virescens TaxID=7102 RepID=A0A2A4JAP1_HELVI
MADNASTSPRCITPIFGDVVINPLNNSLDVDDIDDRSELEINEELSRGPKRQRDVEEEEETWTEVKGKKKLRYGSNNSVKEEIKYEVYISSKERLPKQFAMARILKENNISKVNQVKYLSPFKIRLLFECETAAQSLFTCEKLLEKGWRLQKAMELSVCYGLIKDVDLDLADDEILKSISCPAPAKLISCHRLNRRNRDEGGWCPSETLRLCFEGSHLPATVRVCDINMRVYPYIHQVSQCSQCWKLGHTRKMCPSKNTICPKCGGHHENCDTTTLSCVNCKGDHISLSKACPAYKKERKLREIMAEFGCTYRKALEIYVPPEMPIPSKNVLSKPMLTPRYDDTFPCLSTEPTPIKNIIHHHQSSQLSYAETVKVKASIHEEKTAIKSTARPQKPTMKRPKKSTEEDWTFWNSDGASKEMYMSSDEEVDQKEQCPSFKELWVRIKEVIFLKQHNISYKIRSILQLCLEWFMLVSVSFVSDWPWIKTLFSFINTSL